MRAPDIISPSLSLPVALGFPARACRPAEKPAREAESRRGVSAARGLILEGSIGRVIAPPLIKIHRADPPSSVASCNGHGP